MGLAGRSSSAGPPSSTYDGFISYSHAADDLLAPRLQAGLQKFAKPWWKRRAVRIFRDESSLAANPHLWSSITEALDSSGWFVLLLSPDAAASEWVGKEIEHWKANKPGDRILPVVTDGEFGWLDGDVAGSSVPAALEGVFPEEPRWVDLRNVRGETQLDLKNPTFSAAIADVAATIRGIPKDDLASEEVRQYRRTIRTAWAAGIVVLLLGVAATIGAVTATNESDRANEQAGLAAAEADRATAEADRADREADAATAAAADANQARDEAEVAQSQAEIERDRADDEARRANGEALAAQALNLVDRDPELALLLAVQSLTIDLGGSGISTAYAALIGDRQLFETTTPGDREPVRGVAVGGLHPDGHLLAVAASSGNGISVHEVDTGETRWTVSVADEELYGGLTFGWRRQLTIEDVGFSADGSTVIATITTTWWDFNAVRATNRSNEFNVLGKSGRTTELRFYDSLSGERTSTVTLPNCHEPRHFPGVHAPYFDTDVPLLISLDSDCDANTADGNEIGLFDTVTGTFTSIAMTNANVLTPGVPTRNATASRIAYADETGGTVIDTQSNAVLFEFGPGISTLSDDGSTLLLTNQGTDVVELWDIDRSARLWTSSVAAVRAWFSADGSVVYAATDEGSAVILDSTTGVELFRVRGHKGLVSDAVLSTDGNRLATFGSDGTARVWDVSRATALPGVRIHDTVRVHEGLTIDQSGSVGVAWLIDEPERGWQLRVFDPRTGETIRDIAGGSPGLSEDGTVLAYRTVTAVDLDASVTGSADLAGRHGQVGNVELIEIGSGTVSDILETFCNPYVIGADVVAGRGCNRDDEPGTAAVWDIEVSPDGRFVAMNAGTHDTFTIWDLESGNRGRDKDAGRAPQHITFSPDSTLVATHYQDLETCFIAVFNAEGLAARVPTDLQYLYKAFINLDGRCATAMEFTPDGATLIIGNTRGAIQLVETANWTTTASIAAHQGPGVDHIAINLSGTLLATSGLDGLKIWDLPGPTLFAAIDIDASGGVAFVDDDYLMVLPRVGASAIAVTLDPAEVRALLIDRLTRAFTPDECATYGIAPCPTLEEMQSP